MSAGRDLRSKDLVMLPAPVEGGLEPRLLPPTRQAVRDEVEARIPAYTPEWRTSSRPDDAGRALVQAYGTVAEAVNARVNRVPRRMALDHLAIAGIRSLQASPARAVLALEAGPQASTPIDVPAGSAFLASGGDVPVVLETEQGCAMLPGAVATVAVLSDGWRVSDQPSDLGALAPFGPRPAVPAELWLGIDSPVAPEGRLSFAIDFVAASGRVAFSETATVPRGAPPTLRWEAMTATGAVELPVESDGTAGLSESGVLVLRVDLAVAWPRRGLPGRTGDRQLRWVRARLVSANYPSEPRLARITLNGVAAVAARSVRGEVLEPIERSVTGRSRYRLSQIPVVPGSVLIDVTGDDAVWEEAGDLASLGSDDRGFVLDAATGIATFGDGVFGRAVPDGYRNVVARVYATGGGTAGLPEVGAELTPRRSIPNLTGATVLSITSGADTETAGELVLRGPAELCSRGRAVAPADYGTLALATSGVDVARAHCLPGRDPRAPGAPAPGVVGIVVVPQVAAGVRPAPSPEALRAVAEHLAREVGVVGAEVIAAAPIYREIVVGAVLVARAGSDLAAATSAVRDAIDAWLDPLRGAGGAGWPFGGAVSWRDLTQHLLAEIPALEAVSRLGLRLDGRRLPACADAEIEPGELVWPGSHLIEIVTEGRTS